MNERPVELFEVRRLSLVETPPPEVPPEQLAAMELAWAAAVAENPALFDGPVTTCTGVTGLGSEALEIRWAPIGFRYWALRRVPGARRVGSFFVTVLQTDEHGRLLLGRESASTAAPGRWQLPGGSVEPPEPGRPLDLAALRRHATVELVEEVGIVTPPQALDLRFVTRGRYGSTGVHFRAPARPAAELLDQYALLAAAERAEGREPELERLALIADPAEVALLEGTLVDYLAPVATRFHELERPPGD
ncbi:NUDIX hydrolase [Kitasatospora viridis]|uniref:NUDIX hydrolase n=1 Tax=Kitasatospora viridis TaxID=281105 RepID=UPI001FE8DF3B|nr:NUDIX hydrolase [Kitasatospora viridis]